MMGYLRNSAGPIAKLPGMVEMAKNAGLRPYCLRTVVSNSILLVKPG
jgi:hypothetical protein